MASGVGNMKEQIGGEKELVGVGKKHYVFLKDGGSG
jgi:hypothetical protein